MVVTIIGIVAAIAVPRVSQASRNASANALQATLAGVRTAIDVYYAEHGQYPGYFPGTSTPDGVNFVKQLTYYSDASGATNKAYSSGFMFGPYLREPFPKNPWNNLSTVFVKATPAMADPADGSYGWVAVLSHGYFGISTSDQSLEQIGIIDINTKKEVRGLLTE